MTRLDYFILRMQAQRACIDEVARSLGEDCGLIVELGLGNGRTYDHLRHRFGRSRIVVFDREIAAHPECIPALADQRLGDFRVSVPEFSKHHAGAVAFVHADIGSANKSASLQLARDLAPSIFSMLMPGAYLACDQTVDWPGLDPLPLPGSDFGGRYHFYRRAD